MYDFIIIHGSYGSPFENWFPWLYQQLENKGFKVLVPQMPCGDNQNYDNWSKVLNSYKNFINENTTFICHSLAPAFIINYLIDKKLKIKKAVLVAPFYQKLGNEDFDKVNISFFIKKDFAKISNFIKERYCIISRNDPYVPNIASIDFANMINAKIVEIDNAGHFNSKSGYTKFDLLLKYL